MLINQLKANISKQLGVEPTTSQLSLIDLLSNFTQTARGGESLIVQGYAGTGKTSTISAYVRAIKELGFKCVLLAPTGRAAKVFSSYAKQPAYTIHKKIYRQLSSKDGFGRFQLEKNLHTRTFFLVDEASMITNQGMENNSFGSGALLTDLCSYVNNDKNCNLILIGDTAQLPPVGISLSPALEKSEMKQFSYNVSQCILTEVVRQTEKSGILHNATYLRNKIAESNFDLPLFDLQHFPDIIPLSGNELVETITESYDRCGSENVLIVTRSNKRANKYNQGIRTQILWREEELAPGDLLMVVKNNYFWLKDYPKADFIANGDIVELVRVQKYIDLYGFRFAECSLKLVDYELELDTLLVLNSLHSESASLTQEENRNLFYTILEDFQGVKPRKKQYDLVRSNKYFNALQIKYANAVTCHKAQGGQWKEVFIDAGYLTKEIIDKDYLRWLYTALTRATDKVYLVGFKDEYLK